MIGNLKIAFKFILIIVLPIFFIWITDLFVPMVTFKFAIVLIVFGILWSAISSAYLILDGHGTPFSEKPPKKLVTAGPYSMSRHPIYFGFIVYTLGLSLYFNLFSLWIWALFVILIVIHALIEDKSILKKFKDAQAYKKSVPLLLPMKKWRVNPVIEPPFLYAFMFLIGKFIVPFFFDVRISGREKIPDGPYVVVSNHTSYPDPLFVIDALNSYVRFPITSAHYENFAWFFDSVGMFSIKRYTVDVSAIMKFTKTMKSGGIIGIFPEGERNWDGRPLEIPEGVVRLLKMSPNPILPVRIKDAHLLWPRWAKTLHKGIVEIEIGDPVDPKDYSRAFDYIFVDSFKDKRYADYRGIEKYLWKCPSCGTIGTIRSFKNGFKCDKCGTKWVSPTVEEVRKLHDSIKFSSKDLPLFDHAFVNGLKMKIEMAENTMNLGGKIIRLSEIQSFLTESNKTFYIFTNELFVVNPLNSSSLMWKEYFDFLKTK